MRGGGVADQSGVEQMNRLLIAYAVRNNEGYWVGIWNDRASADIVLSKGQPTHGERVVVLCELVADA